ncbi:alpha/beta fold hydrolase [Microbispora sp. ATCC PTA-5024]|uniref:alpha/beta fold hydrolase n=1 Tax=Microbispora sp. ATCC PTA-5024 TaxID=316330 RepID=UPI0003DDED26|nr:alpha/beta hydrolase [Microbispora sp. ATCC PTA-5024]ETK37157.1 alpha/beta hydrolase [Microbispora sp. ATCC PTA-5024]
MSATKTDTLQVPGASLYYEVRGDGPVLLLIPGAPGDAAMFGGLAEALSDRYTVVTYDARGLSRSTLDGPAEDQRIEVHADDAHRLLSAVTSEPAYVFGASGGALVALDLLTRHPEQVRALVAHEPPAVGLLPDADHWTAFTQEISDIYAAAGWGAAMGRFGEGMGLGGPEEGDGGDWEQQGEPDPEMLAAMARFEANADFFFKHVWSSFMSHTPDVEGVRSAEPRVVIAGGDASDGQVPRKAAAALADRLGTGIVDVPGDHGGFTTQPDAFAETLHKILQND